MLWDRLRDRVRDSLTNWSASDAPFAEKTVTFAKNRARALRHGCCGNHGQPGC